jgi:protein-disulfide isomerase
MDIGKYSACLDDPSATAKIEADQSFGKTIGVTSTPTFFLGKSTAAGHQIAIATTIKGAQPLATFSAAIDDLADSLPKAKRHASASVDITTAK